jgi:hypothetical protein
MYFSPEISVIGDEVIGDEVIGDGVSADEGELDLAERGRWQLNLAAS